jgi:AcrR family transcriptional regulator
MKTTKASIQTVRRNQVVEAAVAIIAEQGLQSLSLSEIESRTGMSRGQLTYYFPSKEQILLAVFDRLVDLMYERIGRPPSRSGEEVHGWDLIRYLFEKVVVQSPVSPEFHVLQYTFLSQIGHRADFRKRLASLYDEWRNNLTKELGPPVDGAPNPSRPSARALATVIQALLHGLAMQAAADPQAFDREEIVNVCLDMLSEHVRGKKASRNGSSQ